ncbi:amino acid ABC transporter [Aureimonas flava]|uniref:Amino acid ABC transporter n=1 Tax=Aureimonas flava TaxID=2320271 RepID=A0A3A1WJR7_9HYPH|nr:transporter substrate-binding domain-containing protein [Aureimonas flava]RIY01399.1 amino acid ABC transporter [Aureimonas flava]
MNRRTLLLAGLAAPALFGLGARASAEGTLAVQRSGRLRVALEFGRPPWGYKDDALQPSGSDYDTALLLAKDLGVALEIVEVSGPNRVPILLTDKADVVISTFSITPERRKVVAFSVPYASAVQYVAAPRTMELRQASDLSGQRVGVTRGTTGDGALTKLGDPTIEIVRFDDESTNMTAFASGQVDVVVQEPAVIRKVAERNPERGIEQKFTLAEFPVGVGLRKENTELIDYVDGWVRANVANGKLNDIYRKYHGVDLPPSILNG